jgi:uncharacterized protein YecE (DUF72 family)
MRSWPVSFRLEWFAEILDLRVCEWAAGNGVAMIRVGIGGFVFAAWRGVFYPHDLPRSRELAYASRQLTSIEINGTFYRTQDPASFRRWYAETPASFVFSLKGPRYATHRRELSESGASIERFLASGILELREKLGPILWQFPPTARFDEGNLAAFLELLPSVVNGRTIRHVIEIRDASFVTPEFIALLRRHRIALAFVDSDEHPEMYDVTGDFIYLRLRRSVQSEPAGYSAPALDSWARRLHAWSTGGEPDDARRVHPNGAREHTSRDCFAYFISGAKVRAPAAALALIERLARQ